MLFHYVQHWAMCYTLKVRSPQFLRHCLPLFLSVHMYVVVLAKIFARVYPAAGFKCVVYTPAHLHRNADFSRRTNLKRLRWLHRRPRKSETKHKCWCNLYHGNCVARYRQYLQTLKTNIKCDEHITKITTKYCVINVMFTLFTNFLTFYGSLLIPPSF